MTSNQHAPQVSPNGLVNQARNTKRTSEELPSFLGNYIPVTQQESSQGYTSQLRAPWLAEWQLIWRQIIGILRSWRPRQILGLPLVLIATWMLVLWWGEEIIFRRNVESCAWGRWENWPARATPHHVVLVADPQLVDPHTYPGRPWPLSTLTIRYTDLYMRKSFQQIQKILDPQSVFFLGDLFDGGREWSTGRGEGGQSVEKSWRKYDTTYWLKEYRRFSRIFFDPWLRGGQGHRGRKMIVGLPGNHDLGLGSGIRLPVRKRFHAYFGWGNRIDVVGNHTFVSLDTVSLSAKGQTDPATGSQRVDDANKESWGPVENFLRLAQAEKARVVARELRVRYGKPENDLMNHDVIELEEDPRARTISIENLPGTDMPSIILTHVPLYRAPGTPCGALRERYPPSRPGNADGEPPETDDANSIPLQQGIQYQNVLTQQISNELVDLVGDVTHAFSGDDHDYCDIIHRGYTSKNGGIREVTVKSISWAMGVRKPGVVLLSLWNPVDEDGKAVGQDASKAPTIQTHLCLLPDQLSIFIRYGWLLAFTLLLLFIRACKMAFTSTSVTKEVSGHLLPLPVLSPSSKHQEAKLPRAQAHPSHVSSSSRSSQTGLAVRSSAARSRNRGLANGYGYHSPAVEDEEDEVRHEIPVDRGWNDIPLGDSSRPERRRGMGAVYDELRESVVFVALVVLGWYFWLLWNS